ncbi:hypothetical protein BBBOND_0208950 [Babesia bigemina]|uniref:Uncharacterized protein n=1 Tax=Babesia bigemina TaxID=5866 RepID=A0A061D4W9_BABBI|nr:hypothetical protein BBBOND_0208950 [Babesia bigemina]CDR95741.1 hypothetical protein BBBOND_0208950 [Babesia bigemina]|eukprot:XP_012767927.1 hypothetical protein BBBOND_0208950 [Babesia bigemina]
MLSRGTENVFDCVLPTEVQHVIVTTQRVFPLTVTATIRKLELTKTYKIDYSNFITRKGVNVEQPAFYTAGSISTMNTKTILPPFKNNITRINF